MSRFSAGVAPRTSVTWSSHDLPKIVTTGVSAATSSCRFGSSPARVRAVPGRAERGQLGRLPAHLPGRREELDVLGVGARPAALDVGHAVLVEHPGDAQLVGEREGDVLALRAVAQGRVVEDDRAVGGAHAGTPALEPLDDGRRERGRPDHDEAVGRRRGHRRGRRSASRRRAPRTTAASMALATSSRPSDSRKQHRGRQDRADRVRLVLAGDVRRRAVDRLVQPERAVRGPALAERGRRQHPERCRPARPPRRTGCRRTGSR